MTPTHPIVEALVARLDDNLREAFEERAGILQFEAGQARETAEPLALLDVVRMNPMAFAGVVCLGATASGARVFAIAAEEGPARAALEALGGQRAARVDLAIALASLGGVARLTSIA